MIPDFLWQQGLLFVLGSAFAKTADAARHRLVARRMRRFLGLRNQPAMVTLILQVLSPLDRSNFAALARQTVAVKDLDADTPQYVRIHADVIHLHDFLASQQLWELFSAHRIRRVEIRSDIESLGRWQDNAQVVCLGSPNHNVVTAETIALARGPATTTIHTANTTDTLDGYRVLVDAPTALELAVSQDRALGVIARLRHPQIPDAWVLAVWGCRAESTLATARYLRRNFRTVARWASPDHPLVVILAIRGHSYGVAEPMYVACDEVLLRDTDLLHRYTPGSDTVP